MSNLEYIAQARKLLTEDYKTKHTNEYNSWMAGHQNSWMQPHVIVPFPPFIVSGALAPFKPSVSAPSEDAVVAKALELYNQFNPAPVNTEKVKEPVPTVIPEPEVVLNQPLEIVAELAVEESIVDSVVEETIVEPIVETVAEPVVEEPLKNTDVIYKIFQELVTAEPVIAAIEEPMPPTTEAALSIVPQPAEELAKVKNSGGILPSVLQRLQDMKSKWSTTGERNV